MGRERQCIRAAAPAEPARKRFRGSAHFGAFLADAYGIDGFGLGPQGNPSLPWPRHPLGPSWALADRHRLTPSSR